MGGAFKLVQNYSLSKVVKLSKIYESENIFYLKSHANRLKKALLHYEIYKKISNVPGDIFEFGVFRGCSLIRFATYRDLFRKNYKSKIYGFDDFGKFTQQSGKKDKIFIKRWKKDLQKNSKSDSGISVKELTLIIKKKKFKNVHLIKGNILKTLPKFLKHKKNLKISLLHLDTDVYEPTLFILEKLYDKVQKGGVILIDDYGIANGVTRAVNKFKKIKKIKTEKLGNLSYFKI